MSYLSSRDCSKGQTFPFFSLRYYHSCRSVIIPVCSKCCWLPCHILTISMQNSWISNCQHLDLFAFGQDICEPPRDHLPMFTKGQKYAEEEILHGSSHHPMTNGNWCVNTEALELIQNPVFFFGSQNSLVLIRFQLLNGNLLDNTLNYLLSSSISLPTVQPVFVGISNQINQSFSQDLVLGKSNLR